MSNFFELALSACFNIIGCLQKKLCYLLFSISVAIGQLSSNWPGWSSRTVNSEEITIILAVIKTIVMVKKTSC